MADIRVLHVDDEPAFVELTEATLEREGDLEVVSTTDPASVLDRIEERAVDCVVSDYEMPQMDGLAVLREVREEHPELPFVLFTGKGSEEIASEAVSAGVDDYLQKSGPEQFELLANRVRNLVSRHRAQQAREESERQLSTLISNIPGMAYRSLNDPDWPDVYVSEGCEELTGYTAEVIVDGDVVWDEDITHPEDQGAFWEDVQAALEEREHFEITYRILTRERETRWVWERGRGVYEDGEPVAIEGFVSDITDRVEMEQELRALNEKVGALHDVASRMAAIETEAGVYDLAVEAAEDVLDLSTCYFVEAVGDHFEVRAAAEETPDDRFQEVPLHRGAVEAVYRRGEPLLVDDAVEHPDADPDDDTYPSGITLPVGDVGVFQALSTEYSSFDEDDLELARLLVAHVSEAIGRVRTRDSLRAERDRFAALFENIPDPGVVVEFQGDEPVITSANSAFEETFGYSAAEARGASVDELVVPDDRAERGREISQEVLAGEHVEREVERVTADGERRRFLFRSVTVEQDEGTTLGFGIYTDVTDRD
jgi:PAS domain S-box-containing protein